MESINLKYPSRGEPIYWSSDRNKLTDLVDFCVRKGIPQDFAVAKSCRFILRSFPNPDHTPAADALNHENDPILSNRHRNWDDFRHLVNERLTLNIPLKTEDIEAAAKFFNDTIQWAGWNGTPEHKRTLEAYNCPIKIKQKIEEKRRVRRKWHRLQTPASKRLLIAATQEFKELHDNKNDCIQTFLQGLTPTESIHYSLRKATKKLKHVKRPSPPLRASQGTWVRSNIEKAHAFAKNLADVFQPHPSENEPEEEEMLIQLIQLEPPIKCFKRAEVQEVISNLNPKKSSGYNLIIGKILKELPIIRIKYLT
jgi:hypothetical protein